MFPALVQIGVPGGPELLIIFMMMFMLGIPAILVALVVFYFWQKGSGDDDRVEKREREVDEDRVAELEREVEELREELAAVKAGDDGERD